MADIGTSARACVAEALARAASRRRPVVASATVEIDPDIDVAACVVREQGRGGALLRMGAARPRPIRDRSARQRGHDRRHRRAGPVCVGLGAGERGDARRRDRGRPLTAGRGAAVGRRLRVRARRRPDSGMALLPARAARAARADARAARRRGHRHGHCALPAWRRRGRGRRAACARGRRRCATTRSRWSTPIRSADTSCTACARPRSSSARSGRLPARSRPVTCASSCSRAR